MLIEKRTRVRILPARDAQGRVVEEDDGITGKDGVLIAPANVSAEADGEIEVELLNSVRCHVPDYRVRILPCAEVKR